MAPAQLAPAQSRSPPRVPAFAITIGAIGVLLVLRAVASAVLFPLLDFAGGLLIPMAASFTLIMLPHVALPPLRRAATLVAACCLFAGIILAFAPRQAGMHTAPAIPSSHRQSHSGTTA